MKKHATRLTLAAAALPLMLLAAPSAQAATCTVNIEQAYQKAVANGWAFYCENSVLTFNGQKQMGCFGKTGAAASTTPKGHFFTGKGRTSFYNGWSLASYKMSGGQYTKQSSSKAGIIRFWFSVKGAFHQGRRHLSELKLKKNGGDCTKVLNEAF